jgi:hypothetical protein
MANITDFDQKTVDNIVEVMNKCCEGDIKPENLFDLYLENKKYINHYQCGIGTFITKLHQNNIDFYYMEGALSPLCDEEKYGVLAEHLQNYILSIMKSVLFNYDNIFHTKKFSKLLDTEVDKKRIGLIQLAYYSKTILLYFNN